MKKSVQECIDALISLEPVFKKAGQIAVNMQKTALAKNKYATGIAGIDIVTEADTAVQEEIISKIAETELKNCILLAEEITPSVKKFTGKNGLFLTLDPIDGTLFYSEGKRYFWTIISLHDGKTILYNFWNYPVFDYSGRILNGKIEEFGQKPEIEMKTRDDLSKVIGYTVRPPQKIDANIHKKLIDQGYRFKKASELTENTGATTLFLLGKIGGYYLETPNPYDGLIGYNYGINTKSKIYSDLDFSKSEINDHGPHYQGWYVVIK